MTRPKAAFSKIIKSWRSVFCRYKMLSMLKCWPKWACSVSFQVSLGDSIGCGTIRLILGVTAMGKRRNIIAKSVPGCTDDFHTNENAEVLFSVGEQTERIGGQAFTFF